MEKGDEGERTIQDSPYRRTLQLIKFFKVLKILSKVCLEIWISVGVGEHTFICLCIHWHELTETIQKIATYIKRFACKQIDPLHWFIRCLYVLCVESNCSIYSPTLKLFPDTIFAFRKIKSVFSEFKLYFCCQVWPTFKYHAWFCFYEINNFKSTSWQFYEGKYLLKGLCFENIFTKSFWAFLRILHVLAQSKAD